MTLRLTPIMMALGGAQNLGGISPVRLPLETSECWDGDCQQGPGERFAGATNAPGE